MIDTTDLLFTIGVALAVVIAYDRFVNQVEEEKLENRISALENCQ